MRYAAIIAIGVDGLLNDTSRNGDISMECVVWVFQIRKTSTRLHPSKYVPM